MYKIFRNAPLAIGMGSLPAYCFVSDSILISLVLVMYYGNVWLILCLYLYAETVNPVDVNDGNVLF